MSLRHLAVAGGIALLSAHLFRSLRAPQGGASSSVPLPGSQPDAASTTADRTPPEGSERASGDDGETARLTPLEGAALAESLHQQERPEFGLPGDMTNDADRVRPGLADFARGA